MIWELANAEKAISTVASDIDEEKNRIISSQSSLHIFLLNSV